MKNFPKRFATWLIVLTVAFGISAEPRAEALSLSDWANIFGVGGRDIEKSKQRMMKNFNYSTALLAAAYENVRIATDDTIANKELITQEQATRAALRTSDGGTKLKNGAEQNRRDAENIRRYLSAAMTEGDEEKLKRIDAFIETANSQRNLSDFMAGIAYAQIGLITVNKFTNVFSGNFSDLDDLIATTQEVDGMLKVRGELSDLLKTATAEYRLNRGIKDPSREEQQRTADQIEKG